MLRTIKESRFQRIIQKFVLFYLITLQTFGIFIFELSNVLYLILEIFIWWLVSSHTNMKYYKSRWSSRMKSLRLPRCLYGCQAKSTPKLSEMCCDKIQRKRYHYTSKSLIKQQTTETSCEILLHSKFTLRITWRNPHMDQSFLTSKTFGGN